MFLVVTDPPYGVDYEPEWRLEAGVNKNTKKLGRVSNDNRADWSEVWALWSPAVLYVWHASSQTDTVATSLRNNSYNLVAQIIWNKDRFALSRGDYHFKHEPCWYAVREGKPHAWNGARDQSTVWDIKSREDSGFGHGTQKPLECMARPIRNNSRRGQVVGDPFLGSGTTLIAADKLGRICYGMELEPKYCAGIVARFQEHCAAQKKECSVKINDRAIV